MQDSTKARKAREARQAKGGKEAEEVEGVASDESAPPVDPAKRTLIAVTVGAVALSVVMVALLVTAWRAPEQPGEAVDSGGRSESAAAYAGRIRIENYSAATREDALDSKELRIDGYVVNSGARTVAAADLRLYFAADEDAPIAQAYFDFPLVIDTILDDLGDGPLGPRAGRRFAVRMGDFPGDRLPSVSRVEVINVRLKNG